MINSTYRGSGRPAEDPRLPIPSKLWTGEYCYRHGCQRRVVARYVCTAEGGSKSLLRCCAEHNSYPQGPVHVDVLDEELYEAVKRDANVLIDRRVDAALRHGYLVTHHRDVYGPLMVERFRLHLGPGVVVVEGQKDGIPGRSALKHRAFSDVVWRSRIVQLQRDVGAHRANRAGKIMFDDAAKLHGSPKFRSKDGDPDGNRVVECAPEDSERVARTVIEYEAYLADEARVSVELVHDY